MSLPRLGTAGLKAIADAVRQLDPEGQFVELDVDRNTVSYTDDILSHETISTYAGEEEPVRAYVVAWLCTVGGYLPNDLELEKRYKLGRTTSGGAEGDILIKHPDGLPYSVIETKAPADWGGPEDPEIEGQLFGVASLEATGRPSNLCLVTVTAGTATVAIEAIAIDAAAHLSFQDWAADNRPYSNEIPAAYGQTVHSHFVSESDSHDLRTDVSKAELDRIRRQLHNGLWRGSRDDNAIYALVVKLFITKIYDELNTGSGERYEFQLFYTGNRRESLEDTITRITQRYESAYRRYVAASEVDPLIPQGFSFAEVAWVVSLLQPISLTESSRHSGDLLGSFFEAITRDGFKQSKGLFFTHYNIAAFMVKTLEVEDLAVRYLQSDRHPNDRLPYVIDPSCGSGTFLLAVMREVTKHVDAKRSDLAATREAAQQLEDKFPSSDPHRWAKDFLFGFELRPELALSTKVNMVLHRDGNTHVFRADGLSPLSKYSDVRFKPTASHDKSVYSKSVCESFDVVITNPPFSIELDQGTKTQLGSSFELAGVSNSENLFLERWYQLLKPEGRLAAVLPESFFSTAQNLDARIFLLLHFDVVAVVSLPPHAFQPWTPTRTSLLFAQKMPADREKIWVDTFHHYEEAIDAGIRQARGGFTQATRVFNDEAKGKNVKDRDRKLEEARTKVIVAIEGLELVDGPDLSQELTPESLEAAKLLLKSMNARSVALQRTVEEIGEDRSFYGVRVENIGYRRTRRSESDRPNELFQARTTESNTTVLNLNSAWEDWEIVSTDEGQDALSQLRLNDLWR